MRALVLVVLVGCGFAPQERLTGERVDNGVAPWRDEGAVEICLANRRVGPGGSAVGGFCFPDTAPDEPLCVNDDACDTRERCVCGRCTIQYCSSNGECGEGFTCNFTEHRCDRVCGGPGGCASGEVCQGGVCKRRCFETAECQTGEVCSSSGRCVVADCTDASGCLAGEICKVQREPHAMAEPSVLHDPDSPEPFTMWLELASLSGIDVGIWRATSTDGRHFRLEPGSPILEALGGAYAPSVTRDGPGYRLYYESAAGVSEVRSLDGVNWASERLVMPGDFHAPGAIVLDDGRVLVYVERGDHAAIALWTDEGPPRDVLVPADVTDPDFWRDVTRIGSPHVVVESSSLGEGIVHLAFDAFGEESGDSIQFGMTVPIPPNDSIGFATARLETPDVLVPYAWNPIFDRVVAFLEHRAEHAPDIVKVDGAGQYLLYYDGSSADGMRQDGIGVARNPPD